MKTSKNTANADVATTKSVSFYNKIKGGKGSLIETYQNINNDSDLASAMFNVIGFTNMDENIDFEKVLAKNETVETEETIMIFN